MCRCEHFLVKLWTPDVNYEIKKAHLPLATSDKMQPCHVIYWMLTV